MQNAAVQVSGLELGGLFGSLSAGAISDHLVRNNDGTKGNVGLRVQVCPLGLYIKPLWCLILRIFAAPSLSALLTELCARK